MMTRTYTNLGDVFFVKLDDVSKKYFQYVTNDLSQLNSDVIRVFEKIYPIDVEFNVDDVINGKVEFYAHTSVNAGVKRRMWQRIGRAPYPREIDVLFRDSRDYGNPNILYSEQWYVWRINEAFCYIGKLKKEYHNSEVGIIISPDCIVHRMQTGKYDFFYPKFE